jgi:hypothetical protein
MFYTLKFNADTREDVVETLSYIQFFIRKGNSQGRMDYETNWKLTYTEDDEDIIKPEVYSFIKDVRTGRLNFNGCINIPIYVIKMFYPEFIINNDVINTELYISLDRLVNDEGGFPYD